MSWSEVLSQVITKNVIKISFIEIFLRNEIVALLDDKRARSDNMIADVVDQSADELIDGVSSSEYSRLHLPNPSLYRKCV